MASPASISKGRWLVPVAVGAAAVLAGAAALSSSRVVGEKPWVGYGGDAASSRFFDSQQINRGNVAQ